MRRQGIIRRTLVLLSNSRWQVLISTAFAIGAALLVQSADPASPVRDLLSPTQAISIAGIIGAILALATSVSFGHVMYSITEANSRKIEAYYRFHDRLYELDEYLRSAPQDHLLVQQAQSLSFELKKLRLSDFPMLNWNEWIKPLLEELEKDETVEALPHLANEVLIRLHHCEDAVSTIGLMSVKQIIAGVLVRPVIKSFAVLAVLMVSGIVTYFVASVPSLSPVLAAFPIFFATYSALIFAEVGWYLYRETEELLDFVEREQPIQKGNSGRAA